MKYIMGVDVGTSGLKCILIDERGQVAVSVTENYPCSVPRPGWSEQDPSDWQEAAGKAMRRASSAVDKKDIIALGFSGQMHGLVALDKEDNVIRPAILWNDQRTAAECDEIIAAAGGLEGLLGFTNNTMLTGYTGGKILWLKKHEPENFGKMRSFLMPKDYIRFLITGEKDTDVSEASGTGLFDVEHRVWSDKLIYMLGFDKSLFPMAVESDEISGYVTKEAAEFTGLAEKTPVFAGGGDAVIQTTGMGIVKEGTIGLIIGTSGVVSAPLDSFSVNKGGLLQYFCNNAEGKWQAFGCQLSSGGSVEWLKDTFYEGPEAFREIDEGAQNSPAGANNLVFLPYLSGERCPYADPSARGVFFGLSRMHGKGDIARAVMEGVTFGLKDIFELVRAANPSINLAEVISSGGGSKSAVWRQIQADIFELPVKTLTGAAEGGAYGAAVVAGVGAGIWDNIEEAAKMLTVETVTEPKRENFETYRRLYGIYRKLYADLKDRFRELEQDD
jgi:xylulokinase